MSKPIVCTAYPIIFSIRGRTWISPVQGEGWLEVPYGTTLDDIEFILTSELAAPASQVQVNDAKWTWYVLGGSGKEYKITKDGMKWTCTCPGFTYRKSCKHILCEKAKWENALS